MRDKTCKCKYQATFDNMKQKTEPNWYIGDLGVQRIQIELEDINLNDANISCKAIVKCLENNVKYLQEENIQLDKDNNIIDILIKDDYINQPGRYLIQVYLEWHEYDNIRKLNKQTFRRLIIKPVYFSILDEGQVI